MIMYSDWEPQAIKQANEGGSKSLLRGGNDGVGTAASLLQLHQNGGRSLELRYDVSGIATQIDDFFGPTTVRSQRPK